MVLLETTKPRIVTLVVITTTLGFLSAVSFSSTSFTLPLVVTLLLTTIGTALSCAGAGALNCYLERDVDARMHRTMNRAIPRGAVHADTVLYFGITLVLVGVSLLATQVNLLAGFLSLLTTFLYVLVYTPLKRITWLNTSIGAIPGALPPLGGWAAASGSLDWGAWILFALLFLWQHPHFFAIAWMYRDDYARAGFKMLSVVEPSGARMFRHAQVATWLMIPVLLVAPVLGFGTPLMSAIAVAATLWFLRETNRAAASRSLPDARRLLRASVMYLPLLFLLMYAGA